MKNFKNTVIARLCEAISSIDCFGRKASLAMTLLISIVITAQAQNPVIAPEVRIPGKAQNQVRRIQKPMTGVLFYRLSDSTMCVRNPDNSVTPLSGGGSGDYSPWDTTATGIIQKDTSMNVGIGTASPDYKLQVAGSVFFEKTVGGRTVHMGIDTFVGFTQIFNEFTSGDTSNVMGITPGDAFMRANTDGTDYDVIMNISDPGGVKIQGKSTTTGNALTILEGDSTIFGGDTLYRFGNNGTMQVYGMAGAGTRHVVATPSGVLETESSLLPLIYTALLTQSDTSDPVATVLQNTLGGTIVWTRASDGIYNGTLANAFTLNKTYFVGGTPTDGDAASVFFANYLVNSTSELEIRTFNSIFSGGDGMLVKTPIEIRVYP